MPRNVNVFLSELLNITTAFYTHAYESVLEFDASSLSPQNRSIAQRLKYRAQIALGRARDVLSALGSARDPASQSIKALAQHSSGNPAGAQLALSLAESEGEDAVVQVCCGIVLAASGSTSEAIELLSKHQGNLEAVALLTQIHLSQNRTDLALKEVQAAKRWAQDSLLINLAEAWLGMRLGGEKYQSTFYVYEELASTHSATSPTSLVGQAVAELHLGRLPEAEAALQQALQTENVDPQAIANMIVLSSVMGKSTSETEPLVEQLKGVAPKHPLLTDLEEKSHLFDTAVGKYGAKVVS
jgi:coatomer subunit epsilon